MGQNSDQLQKQYKAFNDPNAMFGGNLGANGSGQTGYNPGAGASAGAPSSITNTPPTSPSSPFTPQNYIPVGSNPASTPGPAANTNFNPGGVNYSNYASWLQSIFGNLNSGGGSSGAGKGNGL